MEKEKEFSATINKLGYECEETANELRLKTLLYNCIVLLEDTMGYNKEDLKKELGITAKEYEDIME